MFDRMREALSGKKKKEEPVVVRCTETPADLQRGDVIVFWDTGDAVVTATLDCWENLGGRQTSWRWLHLSSGAVLETLGGGTLIYEKTDIIHQGTVAFQRLTGSAEQEGVLQAFEARVREGTVATDPVSFRMDEAAYRVTSTGTFLCERVGPLTGEVWRDISDDEGQNVYFRMQSSEGAEVLGIWTTHIALLTGRTLKPSEIKGLYGA
jgi:hypothetical protein